MNLSSITRLFSQDLLPALGAVPGKSTNTSTANVAAPTPDSSQLSPFAQMLSTLQQLQQSNPAEYQQVTGQIATNLQNAATTAQKEGNTAQASQLSQLATDFTNASKSGQTPNVQDLAAALHGGGHHHGHHMYGGGSSAIDSTQTDPDTTNTQNESLNPLSIMLQTLSGAGSSGSSRS